MTELQEFISIYIAVFIAMLLVLLDWEVNSEQPNGWHALAAAIFWPASIFFELAGIVFSIRRW